MTIELADLGSLPRVAFRGAGAAAWLASHGVELPGAHALARRQASGAQAARLAPASFLLLAARDGSGPCDALATAYTTERPAACYDLPVRDALGWLSIAGAGAADLLARFCALDLRDRAFPDGAVAQTLVAKLAATLVRDGATYHLLSDSASAEWLRGALEGSR